MMKHTYVIEGMTCGNCATKVKSELLKLPEVMNAEVSLNPPEAVISMQEHISTSQLQEAVSRAGNYTITADPEDHGYSQMTEDSDKDWFKTYKPLLILGAYITGISLFSSIVAGEINWMLWMNRFMAGFFIAFSFFKFLDLKGFAESYAMYDLLAKRVKAYGYIYPFIELGLGMAYLTGFNTTITALATIIVMGFSSIGVIRSVIKKRKIRCACLGAVFNLPMSTVTIIEDLLMVAMAAVMLIFR